MVIQSKKRGGINVLIFILTSYIFLACSNVPNQTCKTAKDLMESSIEAINNKNTKGYISLFDFESILRIWESAAKKEDGYKEYVSMLKNDNDRIVKMYSMSYNILIGTLEKVHKLDEWHFELKDFVLDNTNQEPDYLIERYIMKLEDDKNNRWSMKINISKYNDCSFITEPLDVNYLSKGWDNVVN